jgi:hypothetical protein
MGGSDRPQPNEDGLYDLRAILRDEGCSHDDIERYRATYAGYQDDPAQPADLRELASAVVRVLDDQSAGLTYTEMAQLTDLEARMYQLKAARSARRQ